LLIVDEVQTGFGRTGAFLAVDHFNITPDLICLAKSIGGGVPMGAVLLNERLDQLPKGIHGSTFGGNPLACAAGMAALDILEEENLVQKSKGLGEYFIYELVKIESPLIREVRGKGLMVGMELKTKVMPIIRKFQENGVLVLPTGMTVIRFLPPLVITLQPNG
jgi:acetylornithine/LysW-gamma-L-lysine aminotransferase